MTYILLHYNTNILGETYFKGSYFSVNRDTNCHFVLNFFKEICTEPLKIIIMFLSRAKDTLFVCFSLFGMIKIMSPSREHFKQVCLQLILKDSGS